MSIHRLLLLFVSMLSLVIVALLPMRSSYAQPLCFRVEAEDGMMLTILPSQPPPSRTILSFDSIEGHHEEVEWDPFVSVKLTRNIYISKGFWQISLWSEPILLPNESEGGSRQYNAAWRMDSTEKPCDRDGNIGGTENNFPGVIHIRRDVSGDRIVEIKLYSLADRTRADSGHPTPNSFVPDTKTKLGRPGLRSFAVPGSEAVEELLQVLGEIVLERARKEAFRLATEKLVKSMCENLVFDNKKLEEIFGTFIEDINHEVEVVLVPRTCEAVRNLLLMQTVSDGRLLSRAVMLDLADFLIKIGSWSKQTNVEAETWSQLWSQLGKTTADLISGRDVSGVFISDVFGAMRGTRIPKSNDMQIKFDGEIKLVLEAVVYCYTSGGCSKDTAMRLLKNTTLWKTTASQTGQGSTEEASAQGFTEEASASEAATFVVRLLEFLEPPSDFSSQDHLVAGVLILLDWIGYLRSGGFKTREPESGDLFPYLSGGLRALVRADLQSVLLDLSSMLRLKTVSNFQEKTLDLNRVLIFGSTLATFVVSSEEYERLSDDQRAIRRENQKASINTLIDSLTDRSGRRGDCIFSFGGELKLVYRRSFDSLPELKSPVSLPLGLGMDILLRTFPDLHLFMGFFNLGHYISDDRSGIRQPKLEDSAWLSFSGGVAFGDSIPIIVGADFGIDAFPFSKDGIYIAFSLGTYIPFIDFN